MIDQDPDLGGELLDAAAAGDDEAAAISPKIAPEAPTVSSFGSSSSAPSAPLSSETK